MDTTPPDVKEGDLIVKKKRLITSIPKYNITTLPTHSREPDQEPTSLDPMISVEDITDLHLQIMSQYAQSRMKAQRVFSPTTRILLEQVKELCDILLGGSHDLDPERSNRLKVSLLGYEHLLYNKNVFKAYQTEETRSICDVYTKMFEEQALMQFGDELAMVVDLTRSIAKLERSRNYQHLDKRVEALALEFDKETKAWTKWNSVTPEEQEKLDVTSIQCHLAIYEASAFLREDHKTLIKAIQTYSERNKVAHSSLRDIIRTEKYDYFGHYLHQQRSKVKFWIVSPSTRGKLERVITLLINRWYFIEGYEDRPSQWVPRQELMQEDLRIVTSRGQKGPAQPQATPVLPSPRTTPIRPLPLSPSKPSPSKSPPLNALTNTSPNKSPTKRLASQDANTYSTAQGYHHKKTVDELYKEIAQRIQPEDEENVEFDDLASIFGVGDY